MFSEEDYYWMQQALDLANKAKENHEVPVGAILIDNNQVIGKGYNSPITLHDPTAHAEMVALREAANTVNNYRLPNTTLYVTLEPCMMCAGAIVHARIKRLVFAARDPRAGAIVSVANLLDQSFLNHRVVYSGGLFEEKSSLLLKQFFQERR